VAEEHFNLKCGSEEFDMPKTAGAELMVNFFVLGLWAFGARELWSAARGSGSLALQPTAQCPPGPEPCTSTFIISRMKFEKLTNGRYTSNSDGVDALVLDRATDDSRHSRIFGGTKSRKSTHDRQS
jgi:hypothetical protein